MNIDEYKEGLHDSNSPVNQTETESELTFGEVIISGDHSKAIDMLSEIRKEVHELRNFCKETDNIYILKRLNSIYQKL